MKTPLVVSFSGGRSSAYMAYLLLADAKIKEQYSYIFIFANTGKEREETLAFVNACDVMWNLKLIWVEAVVHTEHGKGTTHKIVSYLTASRNGEPFEEVFKAYGISNKPSPHCTRELKQRPITSYLRQTLSKEDYKSYKTALGIRFDEIRRANKGARFIYPLFTKGVVEKHVREFWRSMPFDLNLKSYEGNCDLCWKKSANKKMQLIRENPAVADWWMQMENKYSEGKYFFHYDNESTQSLALRAMSGKQIEDKHHADNQEFTCTCINTF